jgi:N-acetyl-beta-hexosaminidase
MSKATTLARLEADDKRRSFARYKTLVALGRELSHAELSDLQSCMKVLGKTRQDVAIDEGALSDIASLRASIEGDDSDERYTKARIDCEAAGVTRQQEIRRAHDKYTVAQQAQSAAAEKADQLHKTRARLQELLKDHATLLEI